MWKFRVEVRFTPDKWWLLVRCWTSNSGKCEILHQRITCNLEHIANSKTCYQSETSILTLASVAPWGRCPSGSSGYSPSTGFKSHRAAIVSSDEYGGVQLQADKLSFLKSLYLKWEGVVVRCNTNCFLFRIPHHLDHWFKINNFVMIASKDFGAGRIMPWV